MNQSSQKVNKFLYHTETNFYKTGIFSGREQPREGDQRKVSNDSAVIFCAKRGLRTNFLVRQPLFIQNLTFIYFFPIILTCFKVIFPVYAFPKIETLSFNFFAVLGALSSLIFTTQSFTLSAGDPAAKRVGIN